jgi:hypothetical protein
MQTPDWRWGSGPWTESQAAEINQHLDDVAAAANATAAQHEDREDADSAIRALTRNPEKAARIKLIIARTSKLELERALLAGNYIAKADVEQAQITRIHAVRAKLQELPMRASLIAGKTDLECERILLDWAKEICDHFAAGTDE